MQKVYTNKQRAVNKTSDVMNSKHITSPVLKESKQGFESQSVSIKVHRVLCSEISGSYSTLYDAMYTMRRTIQIVASCFQQEANWAKNAKKCNR